MFDEWTLAIVKRILQESKKEELAIAKDNIRWVLFSKYAKQITEICEEAAVYLPEN